MARPKAHARAALLPARLALIVLAVPALAAAQNPSAVHAVTAQPPDARFEIVQSPLAARWTLRLDRYRGDVDILLRSAGDALVWERTTWVNPTNTDGRRPRFQIFTSGLAARFTYLLDTCTGLTWQFVTIPLEHEDGSSSDTYQWEPVQQSEGSDILREIDEALRQNSKSCGGS